MASTTSEPVAPTTERTAPASASPIDRHAAPTSDTSTRSGKATAALVVGVVGVLASIIPFLGLILGVIAVALGATSRSEVRRSGRSNGWMAVAGLGLGGLAIAVSIALFVVGMISAT